MAERPIPADKVEGTPVHNPKGEQLWLIDDIMIDKLTGKVIYGDMSFGGFLSMGNKHFPLPWQVLKYDPGKGGYVGDLDKKMLENTPSDDADEDVDWGDQARDRKVHDDYGVPPYWI